MVHECAHDFAQQIIKEVFCNIDNTGVKHDDIGASSMTWGHHILLLNKFLHWLEANEFTINPLKWNSAIHQTYWLGYWLTSTGLKPWHKKWLYLTNAKCKDKKCVWLSWCCQPLPLHVATMHTHLAPLSSKSVKKIFCWTDKMDEWSNDLGLPNWLSQPQWFLPHLYWCLQLSNRSLNHPGQQVCGLLVIQT